MSKINTDPPKCTRRDFLRTSARAGIFFTMGYPLIPLPGEALGSAGSSPVDLAVVRGEPEKTVLKALELLGGIKRFVQKGQRVMIKPNMSFAKNPNEAVNTSPKVVATVAQACREAGAKDVLVVDHTLHKAELCLDRSGISKACQSIGRTHVLALNDERFYQSVSVPQGKVIKRLKVMKEVMRCDVFINLPTAKSHSATGVSLGMKGLMGVIWDRGYFHAKVDLHQAIADLNSVIRPTLTIIDASRALITGGPSGPGKVERLDTIIAGVDPVAVDTYGVSVTRWYNKKFEALNVKHLLAAYRMGLGNIYLDQLQIKQETV